MTTLAQAVAYQAMPIVETVEVFIHMAGDYGQAKHICREYCEVGLCITIQPQDFIYTGGEESGFVIGLRNYPRFPSTNDAILQHATALAERLRCALFQDSYMIVGPTQTLWFSRRGNK